MPERSVCTAIAWNVLMAASGLSDLNLLLSSYCASRMRKSGNSILELCLRISR